MSWVFVPSLSSILMHIQRYFSKAHAVLILIIGTSAYIQNTNFEIHNIRDL